MNGDPPGLRVLPIVCISQVHVGKTTQCVRSGLKSDIPRKGRPYIVRLHYPLRASRESSPSFQYFRSCIFTTRPIMPAAADALKCRVSCLRGLARRHTEEPMLKRLSLCSHYPLCGLDFLVGLLKQIQAASTFLDFAFILCASFICFLA